MKLHERLYHYRNARPEVRCGGKYAFELRLLANAVARANTGVLAVIPEARFSDSRVKTLLDACQRVVTTPLDPEWTIDIYELLQVEGRLSDAGGRMAVVELGDAVNGAMSDAAFSWQMYESPVEPAGPRPLPTETTGHLRQYPDGVWATSRSAPAVPATFHVRTVAVPSREYTASNEGHAAILAAAAELGRDPERRAIRVAVQAMRPGGQWNDPVLIFEVRTWSRGTTRVYHERRLRGKERAAAVIELGGREGDDVLTLTPEKGGDQ